MLCFSKQISGAPSEQRQCYCTRHLPVVPKAGKFSIILNSDGTYSGQFSCVKGYHLLGQAEAKCDFSKIGSNKWTAVVRDGGQSKDGVLNTPKCAVNIAKNKPAFQSGSIESDELMFIASKGGRSSTSVVY